MDENNHILNKVDEFYMNYRPVTHPKGTILVFAGEDPPGVMKINSGKVIQYEVSQKGEKVIVNTFQAPSFFPVSWALNQTPNEYFYESQSQIEIQIAPGSEVVKFLRNNQDVTMDLLSRVYRGTDGLLRRMAHLMGGSAQSRIIYEIIIFAKRFGYTEDSETYTLTITEEELAHRTGLSRETVSREIAKIKKKKYINFKRGVITIPKISLVEQSLGTDL